MVAVEVVLEVAVVGAMVVAQAVVEKGWYVVESSISSSSTGSAKARPGGGCSSSIGRSFSSSDGGI